MTAENRIGNQTPGKVYLAKGEYDACTRKEQFRCTSVGNFVHHSMSLQRHALFEKRQRMMASEGDLRFIPH